jgi:aspartate/methionine/tyrosine aminotransferase
VVVHALNVGPPQTDELRVSLEKAKSAGGNVRAIAVINPGNPTGGCLTRANMEGVVCAHVYSQPQFASTSPQA